MRQLLSALCACAIASAAKNVIIDTDLFSDVDDAGALLLAATDPDVKILAVNVNYPSSYSALAASAILAHYGYPEIPIGIRRPLTDAVFFDKWFYNLGEFASKVAFHWSGGSLPWGHADDAADPVSLYRKVLSDADDGSVTTASIGFLNNLSGLLNSTADDISDLTGPELVRSKVTELVVMGGAYPSGREFNFWGDNPSHTAHVIHNWPGDIVFSGFEMGFDVTSGGPLMAKGPANDPVRAGYIYYTYNVSRYSWDPLTVLYAMHGLRDLFEFGNECGYNHVYPNGSNAWVYDEKVTNQHWLKLAVDNTLASAEIDRLLLEGARAAARRSTSPGQHHQDNGHGEL